MFDNWEVFAEDLKGLIFRSLGISTKKVTHLHLDKQMTMRQKFKN